MNISKKRGIATLLTVLVIGMMALAVVMSITSMALNQLIISQGQAQSASALFYAESGARDALIRIARDKNYTVSTYSIEYVTNGCIDGSGCATVSVSSGAGTYGTPDNPKIITSRGVSKASTRTIQVNVFLDNGTTDTSLQNGAITSTVWTELTN